MGVGTGAFSTMLVWWTSTAATAALDTAWPIVRIRTLTPFADAVCPAGTVCRTRACSAEYASVVPVPTTAAPSMIIHRSRLSTIRTA
ncbi:hypothetical protein AQJ91_43440 [Streptomyces dysideae]|uniref:Secreted protein n=1 Tax=Streptomyces dysideae TaxID=909626 RepID=A0A101UQL7_9ACTN|nr:hypothetical protein AQJ91_43440 [Streptomyces dysideae]